MVPDDGLVLLDCFILWIMTRLWVQNGTQNANLLFEFRADGYLTFDTFDSYRAVIILAVTIVASFEWTTGLCEACR